jgi:3'(2'), 5'-bisphosphate nucleotidase
LSALDDHSLAADLAERAGHLLLTLRANGGDPDVLRKAGDRQSHEFLMAELARERPDDAVLSEEGIDDRARLAADRVWIVDPLDGTREFGEPGRTDWAVHVALWSRHAPAPQEQWPASRTAPAPQQPESQTRNVSTPDEQWAGTANASAPSGELSGTRTAAAIERELGGERSAAAGAGDLIAGAVALPAQNRVLSTVTPMPRPGEDGAERPDQWKSSRRPSEEALAEASPSPGAERPLRMVVSRSRASELVKDVAARIHAELVPCGSAGAKVATVITGENDVYLHSGGFYEWDTAAPVAVARARGFYVSRIDGSPVKYNQEDPLLPDILVCRPAIAPVLLNAIREATHAI